MEQMGSARRSRGEAEQGNDPNGNGKVKNGAEPLRKGKTEQRTHGNGIAMKRFLSQRN